MALRDPERPEDITPEQARILGYLEQGLRAQYLFKRNKDYLVQAGKVVIIDVFTGRLMPGRRWSDGLHQAVEAKEGVRVQRENVTYATITIQNYFRMYEKLSGMTGTAVTESEEFHKIYELDVIAIPTNLDFQASRPESELVSLEDRDREGTDACGEDGIEPSVHDDDRAVRALQRHDVAGLAMSQSAGGRDVAHHHRQRAMRPMLPVAVTNWPPILAPRPRENRPRLQGPRPVPPSTCPRPLATRQRRAISLC